MFADSHSLLDRWLNHFSQLLNIHGVNDIRQTELHAAEPKVPEPSAFGVELVIEKPEVTSHQLQGVEHFALRSINLLILFGIRRNCLWSGRNRSLYLFIRTVIKQTVVIIGAYHFCQLRTKFYPASCCLD